MTLKVHVSVTDSLGITGILTPCPPSQDGACIKEQLGMPGSGEEGFQQRE